MITNSESIKKNFSLPLETSNQSSLNTIDQKAHTLAKTTLNENICSKTADNIQHLKIKENLELHSLWNHGDFMLQEQSEKLLTNAPIDTWIAYRNPKDGNLIITEKTASGYVHSNSKLSINRLMKGYSENYKIEHMLTNKNILKNHPYNHGSMDSKAAQKMLRKTPPGTWLFFFNKEQKRFIFSIKLNKGYLHIKVDKNDECGNNFKQLFINAKLALKKYELLKGYHKNFTKLSCNLSELNHKFRTKKQTEMVIAKLVTRTLKTDIPLAIHFSLNGWLKLSRKTYNREIDNSIFIEKVSDEKKEINYNVYEAVHGKILGEGALKVVKLLKSLDESADKAKGRFKHPPRIIQVEYPEMASILQEVKDIPYVAAGSFVKITSLSKSDYAYIISDFAETSLDKLIKTNSQANEQKNEFAYHLLKGLAALHTKQIAHRDIKPENINILRDKKSNQTSACLSDFDFATKNEHINGVKCTPIFLPPEGIEAFLHNLPRHMSYVLKGDIYALGMTFYELYYRKHLWYDENSSEAVNNALFYSIPQKSTGELLKLFPEPSVNTIDHLIWTMLHPNPNNRPTATEALQQFENLLANKQNTVLPTLIASAPTVV